MSVIFGLIFSLPTIEMQASVASIMLGASQYLPIDADVENFAVLLLFFWWIRDVYIISQRLFSLLLDNLESTRSAHCQDDGAYIVEYIHIG